MDYLRTARSRTLRCRAAGALLWIATAACLLALGYFGSGDEPTAPVTVAARSSSR